MTDKQVEYNLCEVINLLAEVIDHLTGQLPKKEQRFTADRLWEIYSKFEQEIGYLQEEVNDQEKEV